jgi:RNA polymerase sigma-70 factor (ECF subfamily)
LSSLEEAVERVRRGDAEAFGEIVDATQDRLFRLAARLLGDEAEAEDVLQEAYVRAYDAIAGVGFDRKARVETWLYRIVANGALDALRSRRRARARTVVAARSQADPADTEERLAARSALRRLGALLEGLPADQRTALVLKELEGLPSREIALVLGCSEGAVEQRLVRARASLRSRHEG